MTAGRNPITVNQRALSGERYLSPGDVINLGDVTLVVTSVQGAAPQPFGINRVAGGSVGHLPDLPPRSGRLTSGLPVVRDGARQCGDGAARLLGHGGKEATGAFQRMMRISLAWADPVTGEPFEETVSLPATIGRAADNTVVLTSEMISRHHATLARENGQIVVTDSSSERHLRQWRAAAARRPHGGESVQIGPYTLSVRESAPMHCAGCDARPGRTARRASRCAGRSRCRSSLGAVRRATSSSTIRRSPARTRPSLPRTARSS